MKQHTFRLIAIDETHYWSLENYPYIEKVYGVYLFKEGEATHCCSVMPSSWLLDFENVFKLKQELTERQKGKLDVLRYKGEGMYVPFIDPGQTTPNMSEPIIIEAEDDADKDEIWDDAIEEVNANHRMIPLFGEGLWH